MNKLFKNILVLMVVFTLFISGVNAAKTTKNAKQEATTEVTDVKNEEEKEENTKKEKVTLYLFRQTGCSHCADELRFLDRAYKEYKNKFNIVVYNVYDGNNADLAEAVLAELGKEYEGVPLNIIGSETYVGYADYIEEQFRAYLEEGYNQQPEDVVKKVIEKNNFKNLKKTTLFEAMEEENIPITYKAKSNDSLILAIFFGVIVVSLVGLIIYSRKK